MVSVDRPVVTATVYRQAGKYRKTAFVLGYPVIELVNVEVSMVLTAGTRQELAFMVKMAAVDGWKTSRVKK